MQSDDVKNFYNTVVKDKYKYQYEYNRWFKNSILKAGYDMTYQSIIRNIHNIDYQTYLEVGPGPGTWTRLFLEMKSHASYDLVDISKEMIEIVSERLSKYENIKYTVSDFLEFNSEKKYDFFFSSRALEYIPDKKKAVGKIFELLNDNGQGMIITKTPKYLRSRILGRNISELHKNQIEPRELVDLLSSFGFKEIVVYPVVMNFPILKSVFLSNLLYKIFGKKKINIISKFFAESYLVIFNKQ